MSPRAHVIYGLFEPTTGELRYVGKTSNLEERRRGHLSAASLRRSTHKANWLRALVARGEKPECRVIQTLVLERDLSAAEIYWIAYFRSAGCRLTNSTAGGEGVEQTEEVRAKIAAALIGRPLTAAHRESLRASHLGHTPSAEVRRKMSVTRTGRKYSAAHAEAISRAKRVALIDSNGVRYECSAAAARALGVNRSTIYQSLSGRPTYSLSVTIRRAA